MGDAMRAREALRQYHDAYERANRARLGSDDYRDAMADVRRLHGELRDLGIDPTTSWREPTQRKLRMRVKPERPGQKQRLASDW